MKNPEEYTQILNDFNEVMKDNRSRVQFIKHLGNFVQEFTVLPRPCLEQLIQSMEKDEYVLQSESFVNPFMELMSSYANKNRHMAMVCCKAFLDIREPLIRAVAHHAKDEGLLDLI